MASPHRLRSCAVACAAAAALHPPTLAQPVLGESAKLLASPPMSGSNFGAALAVSGNRALIGAPEAPVSGLRSGAAYIYSLEHGDWQQAAQLATPLNAGADFGAAVALHADFAAVGAPNDDFAGDEAGAVYLYRNAGDVWTEHTKLYAAEPLPEAHFGASLALHGDTLVVAAPQDDRFGVQAGLVYVYRFNGQTWIEKQRFVAPGVAANGQFGRCLAYDGQTLAVGAAAGGGSAYTFADNGSGFVVQQVFARPGSSNEVYGGTVAVSGNRLLVGAPQEGSTEFAAGAVFYYGFDGVTWLFEQKLTAFDPGRFDRFGGALALHGDVLAVAAPFDAHGGANSGSAYVYLHDGQSWGIQAKLLPSDIAPLDGFGSSVAAGQTFALFGSPGADDAGSRSGALYAYHGLRDCDQDGLLELVEGLHVAQPCTSPADLNGDGCVNVRDLGLFLMNFGRRGKGWITGDLDGNGIADLHDFRELLQSFGDGCEPRRGRRGRR